MNCVKIDLPTQMTHMYIEPFADWHIGDKLIDWNLLKSRIDEVKERDDIFVILNGDLLDNATCESLGDTYEAELNPRQQVEKIIQIFEPIAEKIISVTQGNHEGRTYKQTGIDLTEQFCYRLGLIDKYHPIGNVLFIRFGLELKRKAENRKMLYTIYHTHGRGGGRKPGAKVNRLEDMKAIVDVDIYVHSHTHLPVAFKQASFRIDRSNSSVFEVENMFINTGAYLQYGGYGQVAEYSPSSRANPRIFLNGTKKEFKVTL